MGSILFLKQCSDVARKCLSHISAVTYYGKVNWCVEVVELLPARAIQI
jgi:hypothetical protein